MSSTPVSASAVAHHVATLKAAAGVSVTYTQGGSDSTITAVPGRTDFAAEGAMGIVLETSLMMDWIVLAADLPGAPKRGDQIAYAGKTYELAPAADGRWYSPFDAYAVGYRLHTKLIETT